MVFRTKSNRQSFKALITCWLGSPGISSITGDGRTIIPVIFRESQKIGRDLERSPSPSPRPKEPVMFWCLTDAWEFIRMLHNKDITSLNHSLLTPAVRLDKDTKRSSLPCQSFKLSTSYPRKHTIPLCSSTLLTDLKAKASLHPLFFLSISKKIAPLQLKSSSPKSLIMLVDLLWIPSLFFGFFL